MMDITVKDIVRHTSFLFSFMFSELLFMLFPISLFELSFFCLLAVCSVQFICYYQYGVSDGN